MNKLIGFLLFIFFIFNGLHAQEPSVEEYFNRAANRYIKENNIEALRIIENGLKIDPSNQKLLDLAELIMKQNEKQQRPQPKPQQNDKKEEDKKEEKEKEKEKNDQSKDQEKEDKKEKPAPMEISPSDAERMLKAIENEEKELQKKLKEKKARANKQYNEKEW